ncbi:MAG: hypothetical protein U1F35_05300 [Steroidobacteraceae bacterium]
MRATRSQRIERDAKIVSQFKEGVAMKIIAERHRLTAARISQILKGAGEWTGKPRARRQHHGG